MKCLQNLIYLKRKKKTSTKERVRDRAHALLLSNKGYEVQELVEVFEVRHATILDWFNKWEQDRELCDSQKSGRPRHFSEDEEKK